MSWISRAVVFIAVFFSLLPLARTDDAGWQQLSRLLEDSPALADSDAFTSGEGRPVLVTFHASWCPPCTEEFGHLNRIAANPAFADAQIVGVNVFEDFGGVKNPERMQHFPERIDPQFDLVSDDGQCD